MDILQKTLKELVERRRAEIEPDLPLIRAEWNCYTDGAPQYLLLPRKSPYPILSERFPLCAQLEGLAGAEISHVIRTR